MPRRTYPRPHSHHASAAGKILDRHARNVGTPIVFPVPIELIVEQTFQLEILWDEVPEPDGTMILGALAPQDRRIVLNSCYQDLFEQFIGPERYTLAHELAHWVYDADDPDQLSLNLDPQPVEIYCYHRESSRLSEVLRIREINANKLAAHILMPEDLVRSSNIAQVLQDVPGTASRWQVSKTALVIRLRELGLIDAHDPAQRSL